MTEYTDEQLNYALINSDYYHFLTVSSLRAILNALPEQQQDWEACAFEDIQKGDRFKVEHANWSYEGQVKWIDAEVICYDPRFGTAITPQNIDDMRGITLYRIPAPVVHPDPAQHQFIRVDGKDYEAIPESGRYKLLGPGLATVHVINRENITEWTELELVPKEVADND